MIEEREVEGAYESLPLHTRLVIRVIIKLLHLANYLVSKHDMYASFEVGYLPGVIDFEFDEEDEDEEYLQ